MTETKRLNEEILVQPKKNMSNIDVRFIAKEMNDVLKDGFIDNIYEINKNLLLIKCRSKTGNRTLILDASKRMNLTNYKYPIPPYPSQYIISLRKHLRGRRIVKIYQYELDRILVIELISKEGTIWKFIIELFLGGNFLLVNDKNQIVLARKYKITRERKILAKSEYEFPKARGKNLFKISENEMKETLKEENIELVRAISRKFSLAGYLSEEICYRANVFKRKKCLELSDEEFDKIIHELLEFRNTILNTNNKGYLYIDNDNNYISFEPILLKIYGNAKYKEYNSFNEAVDEFFAKIDSELLLNIGIKESEKILNKYERIKQSQLQQIEDSKKNREKNLEIGNLIYEYMSELDSLLNVIRDARKKGFSFEQIEEKLKIGKEKGIKEALLFEKLYPKEAKVSVNLNGTTVKLDFRKNVNENALIYYNKAKKDKRRIEGAKKALKNTEETLKFKSLERKEIENKRISLIKRPKKQWYEKYRWCKTSDGFLVVGGKDATSNEILVKKYMEKYDLFFHTELRGAPVVILKNPEKVEIEKIPELTIKEAATFAASYSNAWREGWGSTKIYFVKAEQVSKSAKPGEFLPKGSFYIKGEKNFLPKPFLDVTIGLVLEEVGELESDKSSENETKNNNDKEEGINKEISNKIYYPRIIAGPLSAIKKQTNIYVRLVPQKSSKLKGGKLAAKIKERLINKTPESKRKWAELISLDDIIHLLPPGGSEISK
ncbi:MAG: ribosome rescue protein RqcH [Candidatus Helarchaeota archaeon]